MTVCVSACCVCVCERERESVFAQMCMACLPQGRIGLCVEPTSPQPRPKFSWEERLKENNRAPTYKDYNNHCYIYNYNYVILYYDYTTR